MLRKLKPACYFIYGYFIAMACQKSSAKKIERRQQKRFKKLMGRIANHSTFYKKYKGVALSDFPIIDKPIFLANFDAINTVGLTLEQCEQHGLQAEKSRDFQPSLNGVSIGLSSGTSHHRGVFLVSPAEQALWAGYIIAKNIPLSFSKKRVALFLRSNSNLYETANGLFINFCFFDLTQSFDQLMTELEEYNPNILIAPAHVLACITKHQVNINPTKVISVAEVLEASVKEQVGKNFSCRVGEIYQATEGYIASTCSHGNLHINEDILIVEKEWIDKDRGRFFPIITDLNRYTLPIIRYRLNDILVEEKTPCPCGSSFTRLRKIEGREDDILWLRHLDRGTLIAIFPDLIRRAMYICKTDITDYRLEQNGETIHIAYESKNAVQAKKDIVSSLEGLFKSLNVDRPKMQFSVEIHHNLTKKLRRIVCHKKPDYLD